ncbi:MAG: aminoacyl-tRNA hydrolase [Micromonosporaceae bacterium]|nr:aminoacyl-tRNA hydrolase [Micromonosporaceae bacterium]
MTEPSGQRAPGGRARSGFRVNRTITIPISELAWRFSRSGGPGGQSVNTADSRVELRWNLLASTALPESLKVRAARRLGDRLVDGVLSVTASEHRAQLQNRRAAQDRLAALIAEAVAPPPPPRRATRPSRSSVEARLESKRRRGQTKRMRRASGDGRWSGEG